MLLLDKSYYDYDFEKAPKKAEVRPKKTQEELEGILAGFGFAQFAKKERSDEELQDYLLKRIKED